MLHGFGHNNVEYSPEWRNVHGGICNGITGGWHDEADVEFLRHDLPGDQTWRWSEQWIPHAGWYLLAVTALDGTSVPNDKFVGRSDGRSRGCHLRSLSR